MAARLAGPSESDVTMARERHLAKAPIVEAVVDFRVKASPTFDVRRFEAIHERIKGPFPKVTPYHVQQVSVEMSPPSKPEFNAEQATLQGYFFKSDDELTTAQFRVDGFTFNRLKPYTSWKQLFPSAMDLWQHYVGVAGPLELRRVALRYINRISLPGESADLDKYLTAGPRVPEGLPKTVAGFVTRVLVVDEDAERRAIIAQVLEPKSAEAHVSLILDIDAFIELKDAAALEMNSVAVKEKFERLREFKNRVFFASLTEAAIKEYE